MVENTVISFRTLIGINRINTIGQGPGLELINGARRCAGDNWCKLQPIFGAAQIAQSSLQLLFARAGIAQNRLRRVNLGLKHIPSNRGIVGLGEALTLCHQIRQFTAGGRGRLSVLLVEVNL